MQFKIKLFTIATTIFFSSIASANPKPQLKIGAVISLSGAQSTYGADASQGLDLALEKLKTTDPDLFKRIAVVKEDDKSNPIDAAVVAKKLLSVDKVDIIYTAGSSSHTLSMASTVGEYGKLLVAGASTSPEITQRGDFIFRTCFSDPFQGSVIANFAINHLGKKKAAILLDHKSDYSKGFTQFFEQAFKSEGGEVVAKESYEAGKKDFRTQLTKIKLKNPEILVIPGYYQDVGLIMKQAQQIGYSVTMLGGDGWDSPSLFELAGAKGATGHYFSTHFSADDTDQDVKGFVKSYQDTYKKLPSGLAALSYDGMLILSDAFKRANSNKTEDLKKALTSIKNLKGATGSITINASREVEKEAVILKTEGQKAVFAAKVSAKAKK